ncbi:MAG: Rne/Rng family ribonuclease [Deltaproteobacteria bacterium]|nr:Rne/Rng family ribonuclease [Deltaproteobacteria bacterium]
MKKQMLINAVHLEQKRMAIVEDGKLVEFNIQMAVREPITGNIYKGLVMKVERGLQAAFVNYGGKKDGFLPLKDVSGNNFLDGVGHDGSRPTLKAGQQVLVQILREVSERKGALLTAYISLPGRYLVLLPNKESSGISRKIEDEGDRKRLKELVEQITTEDGLGFIVRTAGMNRTKQELSRDYQHLSRLWKEIGKRAEESCAPALIYQESDFGVRSLRDYFTPDIEEILVDDVETFRQMRAYCKAVAPRNVKFIKLDKEKNPLFDKYQLEEQIRVIYQDRVELKSGGSLVITPTEALITIDVNSGRGSNKRNVEETAFKTNMEAAEEIARQLRLRDLGGLVVIDFIDMMETKHNAEVEKTFKKAIDVDRARIQLSHISKFGLMELSRQKKQSTIQEISYTPCPFCRGRGVRPSLEYTALTAYRKIETQAVKGHFSVLRLSLPYEVANYLQNQKRYELNNLENEYDMTIHVSGNPDMGWDECKIETTKRETPLSPETNGHAAKPARIAEKKREVEREEEAGDEEEEPPLPEGPAASTLKKSAQEPPQKSLASEATGTPTATGEAASAPPPAKKKTHRRSRHRRKKPAESIAAGVPAETSGEAIPAAGETGLSVVTQPPREPVRIKPPAVVVEPASPQDVAPRTPEAPKTAAPTGRGNGKPAGDEDPLLKLKKIFETLGTD